MPPAGDLTLWLLHVISPCDFCTRPLCSSTLFVELSQLNTSLRFCQKHNFFKAAKIHNVSTSRITWFLPFTLSIPLDQPSVFIKLIVLYLQLLQYKSHTINTGFITFFSGELGLKDILETPKLWQSVDSAH